MFSYALLSSIDILQMQCATQLELNAVLSMTTKNFYMVGNIVFLKQRLHTMVQPELMLQQPLFTPHAT